MPHSLLLLHLSYPEYTCLYGPLREALRSERNFLQVSLRWLPNYWAHAMTNSVWSETVFLYIMNTCLLSTLNLNVSILTFRARKIRLWELKIRQFSWRMEDIFLHMSLSVPFDSCSQGVVCEFLKVFTTLSWKLQSQTIFIIIQRCDLPFSLCWHMLWYWKSTNG